MSYYGSFAKLPKDGEQYGCNCKNGKCSGCGECCTDLLPLTDHELRALKRYAAEHHLTEHRQAPFFDQKATDFTCPFRNEQTRKCEVYPVRPYICRTFICTKTLENAHRDRDIIHASRAPRSLRWEVFGNDEVVRFISNATMKVLVGT